MQKQQFMQGEWWPGQQTPRLAADKGHGCSTSMLRTSNILGFLSWSH